MSYRCPKCGGALIKKLDGYKYADNWKCSSCGWSEETEMVATTGGKDDD